MNTLPASGNSRASRPRGFTLVELLTAITVLAIGLALAAPEFSQWIKNTQVRSTSESLLSGLQKARAEAVRRNTTVRFQLVTSADNSCALSTTGTAWVVNMTTSPAGKCANTPDDSTSPYLIQVSPAVSSNSMATVASTASVVWFNALGRQIGDPTTPGSTPANQVIQVQSTAGTCAPGGWVRCMHIEVSTSGEVRMCDPARSSTDPLHCMF